MKPNPTHIILAIFFLLCLTATQCEKKEPELPPETQIGANTFGCYLNDELFLPLKRRSIPLRAGYNPETNQFGIQCFGANETMLFLVDNPQENLYLPFSILTVELPIWHVCINFDSICYDPDNIGHVFFTKFDTINNIASGRFEFSGRCIQCINNEPHNVLKIQIASGRFDVTFNVRFDLDRW